MTRLIDLEDRAHVFCGEDGEYEKWNIDPDAPTIDAVPVTLINGRINDLKNMLINTDDDEKDEIWHLRIEIQTLKELLEMWAERKEE